MYLTASKLNVVPQPRVINKKAAKLIARCKNPLYTHTKPCVLLWKCLDHFNGNVDTLEYSIKHLGGERTETFSDPCDDPNHAHTEACRVYDV